MYKKFCSTNLNGENMVWLNNLRLRIIRRKLCNLQVKKKDASFKIHDFPKLEN